jgi:multiple antibiotic resistance protein
MPDCIAFLLVRCCLQRRPPLLYRYMEIFLSFTHLAFVGFVALFPPVNPIGTALVVDPLLRGLTPSARKLASFRIAFYCFVVCACATLIGSWIFKLFGISLAVVQLAGGILICKMGWQLLSSDEGEGVKESESKNAPTRAPGDVEGILFYPLAFPMTTGAGTISVLLTLSAHSHANQLSSYAATLSSLFVAILLMCLVIYLSYAFTPTLLRKLGPRGEQIVNRLSAFLVFCVGIQIGVDGLTHLIKNG